MLQKGNVWTKLKKLMGESERWKKKEKKKMESDKLYVVIKRLIKKGLEKLKNDQ